MWVLVLEDVEVKVALLKLVYKVCTSSELPHPFSPAKASASPNLRKITSLFSEEKEYKQLRKIALH